MKRFLQLILVCCIVWQAGNVLAQHPGGGSDSSKSGIAIDKVELVYSQAQTDRYLGSENLGPYWQRKFDFRILSGHDALVSYSTTSNDWHRVNVDAVAANNRLGSLGLNIPVSTLLGLKRRLSVRFLESRWVDIKDSSVEANGVYVDFRPDLNWRFESGVETFLGQPPQLYYLTGERKLPDSWPLFSYVAGGVAARYNLDDRVHHFEERVMLGGVIPIDSAIFIGLATSLRIDPVSWNGDTRAWTVMFAKQGMETDSRWEPTLMLVYRQRPLSKYFLGMGAFGGGGINQHMARGMTFAAYPAMLRPDRIVQNQEFHIKELNDSPQQWGDITWNAGWFWFEITPELSAESFQAEIYHTLTGWSSGRLFDPFWGAVYSSEDDITYNFRAHQLQAVGHWQWGVELGTYFHYYRSAEGQLEATIMFGDRMKPESGLLRFSMWL